MYHQTLFINGLILKVTQAVRNMTKIENSFVAHFSRIFLFRDETLKTKILDKYPVSDVGDLFAVTDSFISSFLEKRNKQFHKEADKI